MDNRTIHPSMKTVWAAYFFVLLAIAACIWAYYRFLVDQPRWFLAFPFLLLLAPLRMQMKRRLVTLSLHDDHLTMESGFFSRTRRTLDVAKVQDVTVKQTFGQRILGVGDLMLETAGESGRMAILNVDRPRDIADEILTGSKSSAAARKIGL
jgi:uncharacterized membrane protein YdbT with pleckstrin-like domain